MTGRDDLVDHGWLVLNEGEPVSTVGRIWGADLTSRHRCSCTRRKCAHNATQEDLLCDWCRTNCTQLEKGTT